MIEVRDVLVTMETFAGDFCFGHVKINSLQLYQTYIMKRNYNAQLFKASQIPTYLLRD